MGKPGVGFHVDDVVQDTRCNRYVKLLHWYMNYSNFMWRGGGCYVAWYVEDILSGARYEIPTKDLRVPSEMEVIAWAAR